MKFGPIASIALLCPFMAYAGTDPVTFTKDVAPLILRHCATCHRPGQVAPFSLLTFSEVKRRAEDIAVVTIQHLMPPWLPESEPGEFLDDRRLTASQIQIFQKWVANGTPEGSLSDMPPVPQWREGWQLGQPDLIVKMPKKYLCQEKVCLYRNFDSRITTRRYTRRGIPTRQSTSYTQPGIGLSA